MSLYLFKSRFFKLSAWVLFVLVVAYYLLSLFAPHQLQRLGTALLPSKAVELSIATAARSGHYFRMGSLLRDGIGLDNVSILETQGTLENLALLSRGESDFAFIQGALPEDLVSVAGISAVARVGQQFVHIVVPSDATIFHFNQLAGTTLSLGPERSGHSMLESMVLDDFGFTPPPTIVHTQIDTIRQDFAAGRMDAIFLVFDLNAPLLKELLKDGDYRLIPIAEAEAMAYSLPAIFPATIPPGVYGPNRSIPLMQSTPFPTLAVNTLLVTRNTTNRYQVQTMLKTLYSPSFLKRSGLPLLNEDYGQEVFGLPLHKAAGRYYRRNAPLTSDSFEIGSALLAGLLFLGNIWTFLRGRSSKRKQALYLEQIVPYFKELLTFSEAIAKETDPDELKLILNSMMAIQNRAENQWLQGELDTEHMENLYVIYGIRSRNAANKILSLQNRQVQALLEKSLANRGDGSDEAWSGKA